MRDGANGSVTIGAVVAVTHAPDEWLLLDGSLQGALSSPQWSYGGQDGSLTAFVNHDTFGLAWLQPVSSLELSLIRAGSGTVTTVANPTSGAEQMVVSTAHPVRLLRSVAYQRGWTADLTPLGGGAVRVERVEQLGLIQAIRVPAGRYRVVWRYAPKGLIFGGAITVGSAAISAALAAFVVLDRRRRRMTRPARRRDGSARAPDESVASSRRRLARSRRRM